MTDRVSMTSSIDGELLTADETAARLRIKRDTLLGWVRAGRVPAIRLGRKLTRFDFAAVVAALKAAQVAGDAEVAQ